MPTIHQQVKELLNDHLIENAGYQESSGGRPALRYQVVSDARFAIGVSISADKIQILATDLHIEELAYKSIPIDKNALQDLASFGKKFTDELLIFIAENHLPKEKILGLGIAVPAVLTTNKDGIIFGPTIKLRNTSLKPLIDALPSHLNVYIENDANSGGLAEWYLSGQLENVAYLSLENGVGGAMLFNGQPYAGNHGRSGEFGHISINPLGEACHCGQRGCLEVYCSSGVISKNLNLELEEFFMLVDKGHYSDQWDKYLDHLALGIHTIHMAIDSDLILGGSVSEYMGKWLPDLRKKVAELNPFHEDGSFIKLCHQPRRANMMGVSLHFIQDFINSI